MLPILFRFQRIAATMFEDVTALSINPPLSQPVIAETPISNTMIVIITIPTNKPIIIVVTDIFIYTIYKILI